MAGLGQHCPWEFEEFASPTDTTGPLNLSAVFNHLQQAMPDAIVCSGAGNYTAWLHRFYRHRYPNTQLAPVNGTMGFGVPAAIAAKLPRPDRDVIALAGDGCFMMAAQELATAAQYGLDLLVLIIDNGSMGTIRMHQERPYPNRVVATDLQNPHFVKLAQSFGAWARVVKTTNDFPAALAEARSQAGVLVFHLKTSLEGIAPGRALHTPAEAIV